MGSQSYKSESKTQRIEKSQMNVQEELNCVNKKLNSAITRIMKVLAKKL